MNNTFKKTLKWLSILLMIGFYYYLSVWVIDGNLRSSLNIFELFFQIFIQSNILIQSIYLYKYYNKPTIIKFIGFFVLFLFLGSINVLILSNNSVDVYNYSMVVIIHIVMIWLLKRKNLLDWKKIFYIFLVLLTLLIINIPIYKNEREEEKKICLITQDDKVIESCLIFFDKKQGNSYNPSWSGQDIRDLFSNNQKLKIMAEKKKGARAIILNHTVRWESTHFTVEEIEKFKKDYLEEEKEEEDKKN